MVKNGERDHFQLQSQYSELILRQRRGKFEAREELQQIQATFHGISPLFLQKWRAKKGVYDYLSHHFVAHEIHNVGPSPYHFFATKADFPQAYEKSDNERFAKDGLILTGPLEMEHPLGTLRAQKVTLPAWSGKTQEPLPPILFEEGVAMQSTQGNLPISLKAQRAISPLPTKSSPGSFPQEILFYDDVAIDFAETMRASGGAACYRGNILALSPTPPHRHCHLALCHERYNAQIDAHTMEWNLNKGTFISESPQGSASSTTQTAPLRFSAHRLFWDSTEQELELQGDVRLVHTAAESLLQTAPDIALHEKNTHQIGPQQDPLTHDTIPHRQDLRLALADRLCYSPKTQLLTLSSPLPQRVLLWQKGLSLSAPSIEIQWDPITHTERLAGKGDIQCTFTSEETSVIREFLSHFLIQ
jgi:hypothetical protein